MALTLPGWWTVCPGRPLSSLLTQLPMTGRLERTSGARPREPGSQCGPGLVYHTAALLLLVCFVQGAFLFPIPLLLDGTHKANIYLNYFLEIHPSQFFKLFSEEKLNLGHSCFLCLSQ